MSESKRLLADIPEEIFWEIKARVAENKLKMKEMIPLAVVKFLKINTTAEELGLNSELQKYLDE